MMTMAHVALRELAWVPFCCKRVTIKCQYAYISVSLSNGAKEAAGTALLHLLLGAKFYLSVKGVMTKREEFPKYS